MFVFGVDVGTIVTKITSYGLKAKELTPEQQLFNSTLKATPYTSTGRMLFLFQAITSKRNPKFMLRFKSSILN